MYQKSILKLAPQYIFGDKHLCRQTADKRNDENENLKRT